VTPTLVDVRNANGARAGGAAASSAGTGAGLAGAMPPTAGPLPTPCRLRRRLLRTVLVAERLPGPHPALLPTCTSQNIAQLKLQPYDAMQICLLLLLLFFIPQVVKILHTLFLQPVKPRWPYMYVYG